MGARTNFLTDQYTFRPFRPLYVRVHDSGVRMKPADGLESVYRDEARRLRRAVCLRRR